VRGTAALLRFLLNVKGLVRAAARDGERYFTLGIALFMLTGVVGAADAKTWQIHCTGSGSSLSGVESNIDTNGDGVSADI
jgi:hypothetical protein